MKELYRDCLGIPFSRHSEWLAPSTRDWPQPKNEDLLPAVLANWRAEWAGSPCWWCEQKTSYGIALNRGELHHLHAPGGKKVNEPWCYFWLCHDCHQANGEAVKAESLGRLLYLKWFHDPANVYWEGIAIRLRRRLPDLITGEVKCG